MNYIQDELYSNKNNLNNNIESNGININSNSNSTIIEIRIPNLNNIICNYKTIIDYIIKTETKTNNEKYVCKLILDNVLKKIESIVEKFINHKRENKILLENVSLIFDKAIENMRNYINLKDNLKRVNSYFFM